MSEFDLSKLVREVHDDTDLTDHRQVAKEVRSRIPEGEIEGAFLEALRVFVWHRFTQFRMSPGGGDSPGNAGKPGNKSAKRDGIREWWKRQLNQRYGTADGQKLLRDFTIDDCVFQAEQDRKKAAELEAKAGQWDELGALLRLNKAGTVGDLP